jgi:hypothetical protein
MGPYKRSWLEATVMASTFLLAFTAALKFGTFLQQPPEIDLRDPILHVRESRIHFLGGCAEIALSAALLGTSSALLRGVILATVGAEFLWYHAALWLAGGRGRCPCLGSAWDWIGMSESTAEIAAIIIAALLLLTGIVNCVYGWRQGATGPA